MSGGPHDVVVVGAGPGGSAAAYALAARGVDVVLLDRAVFPREKVCGDGLTPRAVAALNAMDVLERLRPAAQPISDVEVVAPDGGGVRTAVPPPAMLVVPRVHLDDAIRARAVEAGASFEGGVDVRDIAREGGRVAVQATRAGRPVTYRARLAIVATGASITLPRRLGALPRPPAMMLAARTYVARDGTAPRIEIRFAGVPLPGYGWIFPISASAANAGVGFFVRSGRGTPTARAACERFLQAAHARILDGGRGAGGIRSYPLRVDFPASAVRADGVLFAGEAAGLVNPLTGEGIDYALESGGIAAEYAAAFLAGADHSPRGFAAAASRYERALRRRFERLFAVCRMLRDVSARPAVLNRLVRIAGRRDDLASGLVDIALGNREPRAAASVKSALGRVLLGR